ncbi:uncharacterized protein N0V89_004974 [Didymosphaeria variabile]|uniref:Cytochrome P450 n=1 Tax=Didymosphaeria variabile TaxID=1932322 RepID=A0A9W8XJY3_9PLEO|nr:uncharacterized protein N0V89_004974 [Didymosphaeria variabile]KAJ4353247.1 hypothetical protein N0V89_004974 [Didymosphaeria variabile]
MHSLITGTDWVPIKVHPKLFRLTCKLSAVILLSSDAARDDRWLEFEDEYINNALSYITALKSWPKFLRPLVYRHVKGYDILQQQWATGQNIIKKFLDQKKAQGWEPLQKPPSFFDYVSSQNKNLPVDDHVSMQITMFIAGVHTSAATATNALYDAAVDWDQMREIQKEVRETYRSCSGNFTRQGLNQMVKLDSFLKEVSRFSSPDLTTFARKSSSSITLSNGFRVPNGAKLEVATGAIYRDEQLYKDPLSFKALRFYEMRQGENAQTKHQWTSVSRRDLDWGYGRHACPGRYMADITVKLIMIELFLHYEFKSLPGQGRHPNIEFDGQVCSDP